MLDNLMIFFAKIIKKTTSFMISGEDILKDTIKNNPKLIIIFGHPKCKPCQKIMFKIPFLYIKSLTKGITLKFCNVVENPKDCKNHGIEITPTLSYYENGNIIKKIIDENSIFKYLKEF